MIKMNSNKRLSYCYFVLFCLTILHGVVQGPYKDGDVILGGLLRVHLRGDSENQCGELDVRGLNRVFAMIFAIEKINSDSQLLPNISLGYDIRDYCEIPLKATRISYDLITKDKLFTNMTQGKLERKSITALIGPDESSTAVVLAGLLQALNVSAISPTATSPELSAHTYKYLFRSPPSDSFKGKAMADLIEHFKWSYVAAIGQDDTYGRNGLWSVVREAEARNNSFCLAMATFITHEDRILNIRNIVTTLRWQENIRVVILWLHGSYATHFFTEVYRQNLTGRVWILSDVFISDSIPGFSSIFDGSIVVKPHRFSADTEFEERKEALTIAKINETFPEWWSEIKTQITNCEASHKNTTSSAGLCFHDFVQRMQSSYTPYVIDAVYSIADALNILFKDTTVKGTDYKLKLTRDINVMKSLLSRVSFAGLTGNVSFDKYGDRRSVLYDIVNFQQVEEGHTKRLEQVVVGKWKVNGSHAKRLHLSQNIRWNFPTNGPPKSECLDQCPAGTRKSTTSPCCWNCVACPRGTVNPIPGLETCIECPRGKKTNEARTHCVDLPVANLKYTSAGGVVILVFTICGIITTLFSFAITCRFWNTPIVKASNRRFSIVLQISALLLLTLVVINLFEPSDTTCKMIYLWRYLTYNLCLSFLLVKILRISSAFQIPLARCLVTISLSNRMQGLIVITMHILLLLVLLPWQLLDPPIKKENILTEQYIFIECKAYSVIVGKSLFLLTCSYVLIQILFAAFCSFKIRNVPENFSEAKRIAFSMYIFSFSVLAYYPIEFSMNGWYVTVVDCVTTLLSAYGLICCMLVPKIYIIWFKPELNNLPKIRNEVTQYSFATSSALRINPVPGS